jgi:hypothetical protein
MKAESSDRLRRPPHSKQSAVEVTASRQNSTSFSRHSATAIHRAPIPVTLVPSVVIESYESPPRQRVDPAHFLFVLIRLEVLELGKYLTIAVFYALLLPQTPTHLPSRLAKIPRVMGFWVLVVVMGVPQKV